MRRTGFKRTKKWSTLKRGGRIRPRRREPREAPQPVDLPLAKPCRVVDPDAVNAARLDWCEFCLRTGQRREVDHARTRGARGGDVRPNLVSLCFDWGGGGCHHRKHTGELPRAEFEAFVDARNALVGWAQGKCVCTLGCMRTVRPRWTGERLVCEHCATPLPSTPA